MKKSLLFYFGLACAAGISVDAAAQPAIDKDFKLPHLIMGADEFRSENKVAMEKPAEAPLFDQNRSDVIFSDDFSNPGSWVIESVGNQGNWELVQLDDPSFANLSAVMGPIASTTADNGIGMFNGIQYLQAGDVETQDARLTHTASFDLSQNANVSFQFEQRYAAFNSDVTSFELSVNGGEDWIPFVVNQEVVVNTLSSQAVIVTDVSSVVGNQPDVRVRFRWVNDNDSDIFGSGYGWMIDDMAFIETPLNYLTLRSANFDKWPTLYSTDDGILGPDIDLVKSYEYAHYNAHQVRPLSFVGDVENLGAAPQTNVTLNVTVTDPEGTPHNFSGSIETLAPGERTMIVIEDAILEPFNLDSDDGAMTGLYTVSFSVEQDEEEFFPEDNVVGNRVFRVNEEFMGHIRAANLGTLGALQSWDYVAATRYAFHQEAELDFIEFALTAGSGSPSVAEFATITLNIATGGVFGGQDAPNDEVIDLLIDGEDAQLTYFVVDTSIFNNTPVPAADAQYVRVMLPEPIVVNPDLIYNAEVRVGSPPEAVEQFIHTMASGGNSALSSTFLGTSVEGNAVNSGLGRSAFAIRLGSSVDESVNTVTGAPVTFRLGQNYPNPAGGTETLIDWELLEPAKNITFTVHDMQGRVVDQRNFGDRSAGKQETIRVNTNMAAGVYQYSLIVGNYRAVRKMVIAK